ncbi:MFS transporter [Orbus wheelerorum]|uniref:MFS transporter n=1 Tax=Orbus wheelerorum TaxID=3074111 RepID=UPI00370DC574
MKNNNPHLVESYVGSDRLICGIVLGVITFWLFAQSLVNVAPDVQRSIGIELGSLNLAISLTALFSGCFIVVAGGLADKLGRVKFTYLGFILSIMGSLCLIFAHDVMLFSLGRVIQGLSAACIMPSTLALVKTFYNGAARQRALSFWSIGSWGGSGLCSLAGGAIATYLGWRWIFIFSIICALLGMYLIRGIPESKVQDTGNKAKFDYSGLFVFVIALLSLNLVITKGAAFGWTSSVIVCLAIICVIAISCFFIIEWSKRAAAFIDFSLFKNKPYRGATLSNFLLNSVAGTLLVANTYIQTGRGFSPFQTGLLSIGYLITVLAMIRVGEKLLQKIGAKKPMILGTIMTGTGVALMALTFLSDTFYVAAVLIGFILFGLGLGFYATPSIDTAIANAPANKIGMASGVYKMASSLGGAFGIAISASVYAALLSLRYSNEIAATIGLLVNVSFCFLSTLSIILLVPKDAGK